MSIQGTVSFFPWAVMLAMFIRFMPICCQHFKELSKTNLREIFTGVKSWEIFLKFPKYIHKLFRIKD